MEQDDDRTAAIRWTNPTRSADRIRSMTGLEYMRAWKDGQIPPPPIAATIDASVDIVDEGIVHFRAIPGEHWLNPMGGVHGGFLCTLLDSVQGGAAHTVLQAGYGYTSIDIAVSYLRPISLESGPITATGTVLKTGSRVIFTTATAWDADGRSVGAATSSVMVLSSKTEHTKAPATH